MAYSTTSKYVQLTPYLLMEYMYADQPQPEEYFVNSGPTTVGYDKLVNGYMGTVQIFNPDVDYGITQNTAENSVVQIGTNSFVTLDSNLIIPFNDYSSDLTNTNDLQINFPSNLLVVYDSIRYHIRAGYNLDNIDGIILQVEIQDQNLKYVTLSQILLKKGTAPDYTLNPNPVTIGANIYDKYFEIKIPNTQDMIYKYQAATDNFKPQTLAGLISQSGKGFVSTSPIRVSVWQVQSTVDYDGYPRYDCAKIASLSLEQEDPFSNIGATIKESNQGQFFEYYATDNEGFIEDFILFQNSIGNSYYISHQIEVLEQIGAAIIETSRFESIQTTAYDTPNYYRPIVRNAAYASSFFLRYTMSLINNVDQSRVIRISSYTSNSPAKWGLNITPIQLQNLPQVQKIYNRVYSASDISVGSNNSVQPREIIKYSNVFIQQNYVTATVNNLSFTNGSLTQNNGTNQMVAKGTGKLTISMSPFDNYFKFTFIKSGPSDTPVAIDLTNSGDFKLAFLDNQGNKTYIPHLQDTNIAKPALGELAFKVSETDATKILQFSDRRFFVTNGNVTVTPTTKIQDAIATEAVSRPSSLLRNGARTLPGTNVQAQDTAASTSIESSSVMYWGYWKKEGESEVITTTTTIAPQPVVVTSGTIGSVLGTIASAPKSPVKAIRPADASLGPITATLSGSVTTTPRLTGSALISALSAQIEGFVATGWADQTIIDYFLTPGKAGYIQYPGLTKGEFKRAAEGILSDTSLGKL